MKHNASDFVRAMLAEEDDIFNTLLCRAAKCAAEVWDHLPANIHHEIRDRIARSWTQWISSGTKIDLSAVATLAMVDGIFLDKIIDGLKDESAYVEYVTALFLAKKVTCFRVTGALMNFLRRENMGIDKDVAAVFGTGENTDRLYKMVQKLADPFSGWNLFDVQGARFCDRVAMSRPQIFWPCDNAREAHKKLKLKLEAADRDSLEGIYEEMRLHPHYRPLWTLLRSTCQRLRARIYADGRIGYA